MQHGRSECVESLEDRKLLAGVAVSATGVLNVVGRNLNDSIVITQDASPTGKVYVTMNGSKKGFAKAKVKQILVKALAGNDKVIVRGAKYAVSKFTIFGGTGNDNITGGANNETLLGEAGNDVINAGAGSDVVKGGAGDDFVQGGTGNDKLAGEDGDDLMYGDAGNDVLAGGDDNDTLGGDDEDYLIGPAMDPVTGNDKLNGGAGDDWLLGGLYNPFAGAFDDNGRDTMTGGPGADVMDIRGNGQGDTSDDDVVTDKAAADFVPFLDYVPAREQQGDTHGHVTLRIQVKNKRGVYEDVKLYSGIGAFVNNGAAAFGKLHTHGDDPATATDESQVVHFEAPGSQTWKLKEFFHYWGISLGANHLGRHRGPVSITLNGNNVPEGGEKVMPNTNTLFTEEILIKVG